MKKQLSIIMPVYNGEKHIKKALDSFVFSLDETMELIIINDCSTDETKNILKEYVNNKTIILINNEKNIGAGLSKNKALGIAKGEYIGFIDADDYVDREYFNNMLKLALQKNADIVVSDIIIEDRKGKEFSNIYKKNIYNSKYEDNDTISKELLLGYWGVASACNKIFKKKILKNLIFSESKCDDLVFVIPAVCIAKKNSYIPNNNYYYRQTNNSLTRIRDTRLYITSFLEIYNVINILNRIGNKSQINSFFCNQYIPLFINLGNSTLTLIEKKMVFDQVKTIFESIDFYNFFSREEFLKKSYLSESIDFVDRIVNKDYDLFLK